MSKHTTSKRETRDDGTLRRGRTTGRRQGTRAAVIAAAIREG